MSYNNSIDKNDSIYMSINNNKKFKNKLLNNYSIDENDVNAVNAS